MGKHRRVLLHALDRTGPAMLALSYVRWLAATHPEDRIEVVAFRGGPLEHDLAAFGPVHVVLDHHEPWDADHPDPERAQELRERLAPLGAADVNLLVSVAAGQALPLLGRTIGPIVTWSVEIGEDLHWLDAPIGLVERTGTWLAGSAATEAELVERGDLPDRIDIVPEFVDAPVPLAPDELAEHRIQLGARPGDLLVVGAGIGTHRKGMDLFVEVALEVRRTWPDLPSRFVWIGGIDDPLYPLVHRDLARPELDHVTLHPPVAGLDGYLEAADVLLHPARRDAFPLVCVHAAALGTPVVAFSGCGGVTEMLGEDLVGAPYPDVPGLAAGIAGLADPEARHRIGRAQAAAASRFTAPVAAPVLHGMLVEVGA